MADDCVRNRWEMVGGKAEKRVSHTTKIIVSFIFYKDMYGTWSGAIQMEAGNSEAYLLKLTY